MTDKLPTYKDNLFRNIREFRELMGTKAFWTLPKANRDGAVRALSLAYLGMGADPKDYVDMSKNDEADLLATAFMATLEEYHMRGRYLGVDTL